MIIVELIGLKKSGKTTTAEALIGEFTGRGFKVGAVKSMRVSKFTVDTKGKDTWRHKEAGADFVISLSDGELAYIERRKDHAGLDDALRYVPEDTNILICEGVVEDDPRAIKIVVARETSLLDDTFKVRGIKNGVIALTGIMANSDKHHEKYPIFNCTDENDVKRLADLILTEAGKT
ncbi:MAG: molybdopterin-guanine dinucleotide biosynthesis protein B [Candidatus Thermoplasmatota archaeon]|nr:molybdopterin-guanine dinucleotide biosynthesis protein B [Candidatus Thermoplasmatota archaeon]